MPNAYSNAHRIACAPLGVVPYIMSFITYGVINFSCVAVICVNVAYRFSCIVSIVCIVADGFCSFKHLYWRAIFEHLAVLCRNFGTTITSPIAAWMLSEIDVSKMAFNIKCGRKMCKILHFNHCTRSVWVSWPLYIHHAWYKPQNRLCSRLSSGAQTKNRCAPSCVCVCVCWVRVLVKKKTIPVHSIWSWSRSQCMEMAWKPNNQITYQ